MNNFELIDDYLRNKLSEEEKKSFEGQLESDPSLKSEVEFQSQIVEGLKRARVAELKAMLNNVPVSGGSSIQLSPLRIAAGLVGAAVLVTAAYFYFKGNSPELPKISTSIEDSVKQIEEQPESNKVMPEDNKSKVEERIIPEQKSEKSDAKVSDKTEQSQSVPTQATKPTLDVLDPSAELEETSTPQAGERTGKPVISTSKMEVEVNPGTKRNGFHYQFTQNKAILYGDFDKNLYEILEINGDKHLIYLFYKDTFYQLDESKTDITPLLPVTDKKLIQLLKEYRHQ